MINYFIQKRKDPKIIYFHTITSGTLNHSLFTVINYFTTKRKDPRIIYFHTITYVLRAVAFVVINYFL